MTEDTLSNVEKAKNLLKQAEKKLTSSNGIFHSLFGRSNKIEDGVECYRRAANLFKMAKQWKQAGDAFHEAAKLQVMEYSRHEAACNYVDAAICYKRLSATDAIKSLSKAISIYTDLGRFTMAAKYLKTIAELYETENPADIELAIQYYQQAADYYKGEDSQISANGCLIKIAAYETRLKNYEKAIDIYERIASECLKSCLLRYSTREYFFRAGLCHLCIDLLNAQHALERYCKIDPTFEQQREYNFLKILIKRIEEQDVDGFTDTVKYYDSILRLDPMYATILLSIKKNIKNVLDLR